MTSEEIERAFQQVALSIQQLTQMAVRADERQDAADVERQADESWRRDADERLEALINAQVRYEARQEKLEESFRTVVELLRRHEERLDGQDEARERTDGRLDALIDDQISARIQAEERGRLMDEKLARLAEAQRRTDEQIRLLIERNGSETR
ncbi:MAG: hypothetical protein ACREA2_03625 [Blastocatellia bacterium]